MTRVPFDVFGGTRTPSRLNCDRQDATREVKVLDLESKRLGRTLACPADGLNTRSPVLVNPPEDGVGILGRRHEYLTRVLRLDALLLAELEIDGGEAHSLSSPRNNFAGRAFTPRCCLP